MAASSNEGNHAAGTTASLQHRAEGADRGETLPRERVASARRQGQGDAGGRQLQEGGALAEGDPHGTRAQLSAAITPVVQRLLTRYKNTPQAWTAALADRDEKAAEVNKDTLDAPVLFKNDMSSYLRLYALRSHLSGQRLSRPRVPPFACRYSLAEDT